MLTDFLFFVVILVIVAFFWQLRQMAELSRVFAANECKKQHVQLLAVAMESARPSIGGSSGLTWKAKFILEFSTDGLNQFRAHLWMHGKKVNKIKWPIFPEPEWLEAPEARGSVGGSCGSRGGCNSGKCR